MRFSVLLSFVLVTSAIAAPPTTQSTRFLRYIEFPDGSAHLEAADAAYKNDDGVVVHLIAAVHIADHEFYAGLDESFDHYDALLYEMVKPRVPATAPAIVKEDMPDPKGSPAGTPTARGTRQSPTKPAPPANLKWVGGMQRFLRDHLKLEYQLDGIEYEGRPNFVHADLDAQSFAEKQAEKGETMFGLMLRSAMANTSKANSDTTGLALLGALFSPDQAREIKRVLAQQFADLDDAMDAMEGPNGSVIVTERNKVALRVLREQIKEGKKFIGIFYGAGHLKRMEAALEDEGFRKVGQTWRVAWEIGPPVALPTTRRAR
jgi:hypothetical protein